jgi:hypothetical protein
MNPSVGNAADVIQLPLRFSRPQPSRSDYFVLILCSDLIEQLMSE